MSIWYAEQDFFIGDFNGFDPIVFDEWGSDTAIYSLLKELFLDNFVGV